MGSDFGVYSVSGFAVAAFAPSGMMDRQLIIGANISIIQNIHLTYTLSMEASPAITTVVKMLESLPSTLQEKVVEQLREFIADIEDESKWDASFEQTHERLIASAQKAKQDIDQGKSFPMDCLSFDANPLQKVHLQQC